MMYVGDLTLATTIVTSLPQSNLVIYQFAGIAPTVTDEVGHCWNDWRTNDKTPDGIPLLLLLNSKGPSATDGVLSDIRFTGKCRQESHLRQ